MNISTKKKVTPYLLLLPATIFMAVVYIYPLILTFKYSVSEVQVLTQEATFVGLENFKKIFSDSTIKSTIFRTLKWVAMTVSFKMIIGTFIAILMTVKMKGSKIYKFLVLVPWAIPTVVVSIIWSWIFDGNAGYLNYYLMKFHIISEPIHWLANRGTSFFATGLVDAWAGLSLVSMIMLSGLNSIPESLYEAAKVDGAGAFKRFTNITIPGIRKVFLITTILTTIWTFNSYNIIWVLTEGGPIDATTTMIIKIWKEAFDKFDFGMSSALSVLAFLILTVLSLIYWKYLNSKGEGI
ncbi:MAG: sugar ABC transporter permease [Andreesenia angusta]|nr:sugar ABC transporter permease [Andreesenia angusta]